VAISTVFCDRRGQTVPARVHRDPRLRSGDVAANTAAAGGGNTKQPRAFPHTARSGQMLVSGEIATPPAGLASHRRESKRAVMKAR
jgi:hypothetical protein